MSQKGRNHAILIGSSQFGPKSGLKDLRCPLNDLDGMAATLASSEFGLFTKDDLHVFPNQPHYEILPEIETVFAASKPEDLILFYYSGHGYCDASDRLYLATADSRKDLLTSTWLPTERLRRMIDHHNRRRVVMILDCCYSAAIKHDFLSRGDDDNPMEDLSTGIYIITASSAVETAIEKETDEYGLLTKHLLEGIRQGKARPNDDGLISASSVYQYASAEVVKAGKQKPRFFGLEQRGGELFIARAAAVYSPEQLQAFRKLINELDTNEEIDEELADQARRIIRDNQPKRDKKLFELLDQLQKGMRPGRFSSQWMKTFVVPPSGGQSSGDRPIKPLEVKTTNPPATKPPKNETTNAPAHKPQAEAKPPEGGTPNNATNGFTDDLNGVKLEMVYIPGGKFTMGSEKDGSEKPPHEVTVPAFYIGKFQVTQAQWNAVMGDKLKPGFTGDDLPMESVSWEDAQEFCKKLAKMTNKAYRLPSEAEWEYACRAGTTTEFAFGDSLSSEQANFDGNYPYGGAKKSVYRKKTTPVGSFEPNAFGLYDMHGNVWEWCEDVWHSDYKKAPTDGSAWLSGGDSSRWVVRGGSWSVNGRDCRSAFRNDVVPGLRDLTFGFRVVVAARSS
ncbi:MAG: SUMF1/EgtB/PvdO family nonheme iron enzyme [Acidobacteria bacterium]|nr:SUMF1/EgtB/PvdO family nonheme iron enzyme [Acidobacteriota bacterium]